MNYVSGTSNNANVSIISWSQGGLNVQWAMKYYPSTRPVVSNFIAVSPDIKGTTIAKSSGLGALAGSLALAPALLQQEDNSKFVATLRMNGVNPLSFQQRVFGVLRMRLFSRSQIAIWHPVSSR